MLTSRQYDCLKYIDEYTRYHGFCPIYTEIGTGLGGISSARVSILVWALEEKGFIKRQPRRERSIEIIKMPVVQ